MRRRFIGWLDAGPPPVNPVIDAIKSRRTVKRFDPEKVPPADLVDAVIEAGTWAPNHHMTEPWRFVVVTGEARARLGQALAAGLVATSAETVSSERMAQESAKPLSAPVIVTLVASPASGQNIVPQEELVAAGAALQNMLLAAYSLGLAGFVRTGAHAYSQEVGRFFELAPGETLVGMVYLGYSVGPLPPGKRTPFREKVKRLDR